MPEQWERWRLGKPRLDKAWQSRLAAHMGVSSWLVSLLSRLVPQAPVKVAPKVFVNCVERAPQETFGLMYFRLIIINNSGILVKICDIATAHLVKYYFCPSLYCASNIEDAVYLEHPDEIPLSIPHGKEAELELCAAGIPQNATFGLRPHSLNSANPFYTLTIM